MDQLAMDILKSAKLCRSFSIAEIQSATNNFDDGLVIGSGGFGRVYKGFIDEGATTVAIKRLNMESRQGAEEFFTEVKILSKLRHTNLVDLIGCCYNESLQEMDLVYEYIANGNLADHLYKNRGKGNAIGISPLTWEQRLNICTGAAHGLNYLHTGTTCNLSFIHRDVKTTNILLNENWVAKISDCGLSKGTTSHLATHVSTNVKGTIGYLDPNYFYTRKLTTKSDVYAFGVVLLEVLCGRPAVDSTLEEDTIGLVLWAQRYIKKGELDRIIDPSLRGQIPPRSLKHFVKFANKCVDKHPNGRPTMAEVVESLEMALASQRKKRTRGIITQVFEHITRMWEKSKTIL